MSPRTVQPAPREIDSAIRANLHRLDKPGVLTLRPGYEIANGRLTGHAAIVATVHTKKAVLPGGERLPDTIGRIPVDVREATPYQRLRAHDPAAAELTQAYGRPEDIEPVWPYEREMPGGQLLSASRSRTRKALESRLAIQPGTMQALSAREKKPHVDYVPPPGVSLAPFETTATVTAHVSPDAGLATLEAFLATTRASLVIGMYDFTSGTILRAFENTLDAPKTLQMVLDNPAPNPTRDQTDTQTVDQLDAALGYRSKIARALDRQDSFAAAWMFPYAYHIKVIVRDSDTVWLSSGNLNNSNQPDLANPPHTEDRDWHVIIEDEQLARLFSAYLDQDYAAASVHQMTKPGDLDVERAVADAHAKLAAETNPPPLLIAAASRPAPKYVPPKVFDHASFRITPLFTPDRLADDPSQGQYVATIVQLIASAQRTLFIQLQYIESSKGSGPYDELLSAIAARVSAGVDVRLIESAEYGMKWAEKMKSSGVDLTASIRLQPNVHNKGFVVDSKTVVVSSQNFSPAGVDENRDAGVVIESPAIAAYYEAIFLSDWTQRAKPFAAEEARPTAKKTTGARKHAAKKAAARKTVAKKAAAGKTAAR